MSDIIPSFTELQQMHAEALRKDAEADAKLKQAEAKDRDGEYKLGQSDWRNRDTDAKLAIIAAREKWLSENGEAVMREREAAAAQALAEAKELMASWDRDKHSAAISLNQINEREKRAAAARAKAEQSAA